MFSNNFGLYGQFRAFFNNFGFFGVTIDLIEKNWPQGISSYFHQSSPINRADEKTMNGFQNGLCSVIISDYMTNFDHFKPILAFFMSQSI